MTSSHEAPPAVALQTPGDLLRALAARVVGRDDSAGVSAPSFGTAAESGGEPSLNELVDALREHVDAVVPVKPPVERTSRDRWLRMVEGLELARQGAKELRTDRHTWAPRCADMLERAVAARTRTVRRMNRAWLHARAAAERCAELGREVRPWNAVRTAVASREFVARSTNREALVSAWLQDLLHPDDDAELRRLVAAGGLWTKAYRGAIACSLTELEIPGGNPALDVEGATRVGRFAMPHLGRGAVLEVLRTPEGTLLTRAGRPAIRLPLSASVCRIEDDPVIGRLEVILRPAKAHPLNEGWRAVCALRRLADGEGDDGAAQRVTLAAVALLRLPQWKSALVEAARAFRAGDESKSEELLEWVRHAFEARVLLDAVADRLMSRSLVELLEALDEELRDAGDAVLLLAIEDYDDLTAGVRVDPRAWWGRREALDLEVPEAELDVALVYVAGEIGVAAEAKDSVRGPVWVRGDGAAPAREGAIVRSPRPAKVAAPLPRSTPSSEGVRQAFQRAKTVDDGSLPRSTPPPTRVRWPAQPRLALAAPEDVAETVRRVAGSAPQSRHGRYKEAERELEGLPCPWLRADVRDALAEVERALAGSKEEWMVGGLREAIGPSPGRVPVLAYVPDIQAAVVLELRIRLRDGAGNPWEEASALRQVARDAVRAAYRATAELTKLRCPPRPFQAHSFSLVGPNVPLEVEGDSLALPAVLAFASVWTGEAVKDDISASAGIVVGDPQRVRSVGHVREKAEALVSWAAGGPRCRLLVHPDDAEHIDPESARAVEVATWQDAVREAGLLEPLAKLSGEFEGIETAELRGKLQTMVDEVREQRIAGYQVFGPDPWLALGDGMRTLLRWLREHRQVRRDVLAEGAAHAALAFTYGGDPDGAGDVLRMLEGIDPASLSAGPRVFARVVELTRLIGQDAWAKCTKLSRTLEREVKRLPEPDKRRLAGMVLGTLGRALMHQGKVDRAIPLLRRGLAHHARYPEVLHEAPRSRVYLAVALRLAGRLGDSLEQLALAKRQLGRPEYRESATYPRTTLMFVSYERARTVLAMAVKTQERDRGASRRFLRDALASAEEARELGREVGWPPFPGLLRTQVWIYRERGDGAKAEETLRQLEARVGPQPLPRERRILKEARGRFRPDGEVF